MLKREDIVLIRAMEENGVGQREIARRTGFSRETVRKYVASEGFPSPPTYDRGSILDPYKDKVLALLEANPKLKGKRIWEMLREEGFEGSYPTFQRFIHSLKTAKQ